MRLVAFDFHGALSPDDPFRPLAERAGVADDVAEIAERAATDELHHADGIRERAALLEGLDESLVGEAFAKVTLRPGAAGLLRDLRAAGHHVVIVTGWFEDGVRIALDAADATVDTVVANRLERASGRLTGEVSGPLVDGTKGRGLASLAADLDLGMERTVAVGDGAVDLPMFEVVRLAVGFDPHPAVVPYCDEVVRSVAELDAVLEEHGLLPHGR